GANVFNIRQHFLEEKCVAEEKNCKPFHEITAEYRFGICGLNIRGGSGVDTDGMYIGHLYHFLKELFLYIPFIFKCFFHTSFLFNISLLIIFVLYIIMMENSLLYIHVIKCEISKFRYKWILAPYHQLITQTLKIGMHMCLDEPQENRGNKKPKTREVSHVFPEKVPAILRFIDKPKDISTILNRSTIFWLLPSSKEQIYDRCGSFL
ncbi:hypothetical protein ACJX0J_025770, partial [Zea mays]